MARIGFVGRLMLILMVALLAMIAVTAGIDHLAHRNAMPRSAAPFPRVVHAAGLVDLIRSADADRRRKIVRFANNDLVRVEILGSPPAPAVDDIRAPELEARLRAVTGSFGSDLEAFTNRRMEDAPGAKGVEGRLTKVVAPLEDNRTLVIAWLDPPRIVTLTVVGLPPSAWAGILGFAVAALALVGASREMRPLRRLAEAVGRFDGKTAREPFDEKGAPDVRRLARAVRDMQQRVVSLLGQRSFLIGAISHDLRIYLTRMRLRTESVADDDARARLIGDIDAMTSLIDTSLAYARATTSADKRTRIDLGDLVAIEVEEHAAQTPSPRLEGTYADEAIVDGDPVALRRVVANVLDNALRFATSLVRVRVERTPTHARILIEDDGPGIPEEERTLVFDPYYRAEARIRGSGGTGLGLAIARQIVEAHGGTIEVRAASTRGAAFVIALPPWRT